jgi:hypothetical protein
MARGFISFVYFKTAACHRAGHLKLAVPTTPSSETIHRKQRRTDIVSTPVRGQVILKHPWETIKRHLLLALVGLATYGTRSESKTYFLFRSLATEESDSPPWLATARTSRAVMGNRVKTAGARRGCRHRPIQQARDGRPRRRRGGA